MQYKNEWTIQDIIEYLERNKDIEEYEITVWNYEKLQEGVVTILENKKEVSFSMYSLRFSMAIESLFMSTSTSIPTISTKTLASIFDKSF